MTLVLRFSLVSLKTLGFAICINSLNPSISSISLISFLLCCLDSLTCSLTGTYLVGGRSGSLISETGWSRIWIVELINWIKSCLLSLLLISFESVASALNSGLFYVTLKKIFKNFIPIWISKPISSNIQATQKPEEQRWEEEL